MGNSNGKPVVFTDEVNLNHFRLLRVVGKGAFGKVRIVERKDTGLQFALKYIRKDEVVRSESVRNIIRERRMLEHLNHPFLCNLRYSFQDIEYLYIVVDLMNGGDLRFHISRKTFTEDAVRFWVAELGCALRYCHSQGIVHRDLKPDNVLLDTDGHVHLADFNVASEYKPEKKLHSKSGTLAYLAPEVYAGTGYLTEVDWWSLGVTFYECIYNKRPFASHGHEKLEKEILKASPNYPVTSPQVSMPCYQAISALMEKDVRKRIGASGWETFTNHPFFRVMDFVALEKKQVKPVFIPSSEKTNFDATYDLEELLLEEAPLEARARRQKPRVQLKDDATEKEIRVDELHRMIETLFEPFDYTTVKDYKGFVDTPSNGDSSLDILERAAPSKGSTDDDAHSQNAMSGDSPAGSPPRTLTGAGANLKTAQSNLSDYYPANEHPTQPPPLPPNAQQQPHHPQQQQQIPTSVPPPHNHQSSRAQQGGNRGTRTASKGGGVQVTLDEQGSWANLGNKDMMNGEGERNSRSGGSSSLHSKPAGVLGFWSRKKGRQRSPKPMEAGVLGKEGARVVVGGR
ncbi:Serine/threonine kinase [Lecanora helva]